MSFSTGTTGGIPWSRVNGVGFPQVKHFPDISGLSLDLTDGSTEVNASAIDTRYWRKLRVAVDVGDITGTFDVVVNSGPSTGALATVATCTGANWTVSTTGVQSRCYLIDHYTDIRLAMSNAGSDAATLKNGYIELS